MRLLSYLFAGALLLAVNTACFRSSTVVKVAKDGSGELTLRYYFSPEVVAMLDQMQALQAQGFGGAAGEAELLGPAMAGIAAMRELLDPQEATLVADAENFGEGVVYRAHEAGADETGWQGYTVVYAFEDVNQIKIDQNSVPSTMKNFAESMGQDLGSKDSGEVSFAMEDGVLSIRSDLAAAGLGDLTDDEQFAAAGQLGMKPSDMLKTAADSMDGMRVGVFVRIDGEIEETDATHVNGNLIILSDAEMSKVLRDAAFLKLVDEIVENPEANQPGKIKKTISEVEGITVEMKEEVTVKFR